MKPARSWTKLDHEGNIIDSQSVNVSWDDVRRYRDLRDLPQDYESPNDAADNWPEPPE